MSKSYKGKILISTPDVSGDIFSRSVVLLIDHNQDGAFGLILNKKNNLLSENLEKIIGTRIDVYEGGPVENDKIFFIIKGKPKNEFFIAIDDDYYVTEDYPTIIDEFYKGNIAKSDIKVFSGYSGWASQQLEGEIKNKFWTLVELYHFDYTMKSDQDLWKNIMQNLGGDFLIWANAPQDVSMN